MKKTKRLRIKPLTQGLCIGSTLLGGAMLAQADDQSMDDLKARVAQLEALATKEGLLTNSTPAPKLVSAMTDITVSGYVQASYFYNTQHPSDGYSDSYLWNTKDNSFSMNKAKITVASAPVASDKWDAGFRTSLIFGDDAPILNTGGNNSSFNDLREAYLELNIPIGSGIDVKAGEMISLLNYESGDGGAANVNFSQGYQWWYTGNGPSAGIQASYNFTDKVSLTVRVDNGLFQGPDDANQGKAFSGSLNFKPTANLWANLIGWYEKGTGGTDISGISSIGGFQITKALGTGYEVDYFNFSNSGGGSDMYSVGGWAWYDFTDKVELAFRADYVDSPDLTLGPAVRGTPSGVFSAEGFPTSSDIGSLTLTLNLKPTPAIKIQPEIRYNYTTYGGRLDGRKNAFIVGCGATYMF